MPPRDIATCDAPLTQCVCQVETPNADSGLDVRHVSLPKWTAEILSGFCVSRFHELRGPVAMSLKTPNSEMPMDAAMLATCPDKRTAKILSGFRVSRVARSCCNGLRKPRTPKCRRTLRCSPRVLTNGRLRSYRDFAYRDFASCDVKFL
jgi:hypothetical protein